MASSHQHYEQLLVDGLQSMNVLERHIRVGGLIVTAEEKQSIIDVQDVLVNILARTSKSITKIL